MNINPSAILFDDEDDDTYDNISNIIICSDNEAKLKCKEIEIEKSIWDCRLMYGIGMILSHLPLSFISSHFFLWNDILISVLDNNHLLIFLIFLKKKSITLFGMRKPKVLILNIVAMFDLA
ncbi:hypothetical protein BLOT_003713 [Blomia tropicalis]|nr:hypothetical protein BLOT_003713 [Blomia tropicalis]